MNTIRLMVVFLLLSLCGIAQANDNILTVPVTKEFAKIGHWGIIALFEDEHVAANSALIDPRIAGKGIAGKIWEGDLATYSKGMVHWKGKYLTVWRLDKVERNGKTPAWLQATAKIRLKQRQITIPPVEAAPVPEAPVPPLPPLTVAPPVLTPVTASVPPAPVTDTQVLEASILGVNSPLAPAPLAPAPAAVAAVHIVPPPPLVEFVKSGWNTANAFVRSIDMSWIGSIGEKAWQVITSLRQAPERVAQPPAPSAHLVEVDPVMIPIPPVRTNEEISSSSGNWSTRIELIIAISIIVIALGLGLYKKHTTKLHTTASEKKEEPPVLKIRLAAMPTPKTSSPITSGKHLEELERELAEKTAEYAELGNRRAQAEGNLNNYEIKIRNVRQDLPEKLQELEELKNAHNEADVLTECEKRRDLAESIHELEEKIEHMQITLDNPDDSYHQDVRHLANAHVRLRDECDRLRARIREFKEKNSSAISEPVS